MKLYLLTRTDHVGYDEYDSFVIAARSPGEAKQQAIAKQREVRGRDGVYRCLQIGTAAQRYVKPRIILDSFNAG